MTKEEFRCRYTQLCDLSFSLLRDCLADAYDTDDVIISLHDGTLKYDDLQEVAYKEKRYEMMKQVDNLLSSNRGRY